MKHLAAAAVLPPATKRPTATPTAAVGHPLPNTGGPNVLLGGLGLGALLTGGLLVLVGLKRKGAHQ